MTIATPYPFTHRDFRYLVEIRARYLAEVINGIGLYTPAIPSDWVPIPTTVSEALDILAARSPSGGGETVVNFPFDYTTTYPYLLQDVDSPLVLNSAQVIITIPFNDGATLELGTATTPDLIFVPGDVDLQVVGPANTYGDFALFPFTSPDQLKLNVSGATIGAGVLVYKIR